MVKFDSKSISLPDWGVIGAAGIAFISLFLPWWGSSGSFGGISVNAWGTSYGWLGGLLIIGAGAYLLALRSQVDLSKLPLGPGVIVLGAASLGTLIVALRWLTLPSGHGGVSGIYTYSIGPGVGIILTLIVGIVQVVCAVRLFRASGEKLPWAASTATGSDIPPTTPAS
jgi:hypothetical protein